MEKTKKLVIFGTGEIGQLARYYFDNDSPYDVVGFAADDEFVKDDFFDGLPLVKSSHMAELFPIEQYDAHVALSYRKLNQIRAQKYDMVKGMGYKLASYVCSKSVTWSDLTIGDNCLILENQTIQPTVKIGNNVMIWSGNHLGHGCQIGDHSYLSSHICISGHTKIGQYCFVGVNSTFKDFVNVGDRVFVTMDASVVKDLEDDSVILGAKSTTMSASDEIGRKIRRNYFDL